MNEELNKALLSADVAKKLESQVMDVVDRTPSAARVFIERQNDIWAKVVKDNNIRPD